MKSLVWKVLFIRLLTEQKRLFITAIITVSLGVALALGIRLGTQSAIESMRTGVGQHEDGQWSDIYTAETPSAQLALTDLAMRFQGEIFSNIEATLAPEDTTESDDHRVQISVFYSQSASGADTQTRPDPVQSDIILFAPQNCQSQFRTNQRVNINGQSFMGQVLPQDSDKTTDCRLFVTSIGFVRNKLLSELIQASKLSFIFPKKTEDDLERLKAVEQFAQSTTGVVANTAQKRLNRLTEVTASFRTNLQLMGLIALFIGFAIVHHVFSLIITKQSKNIASLSAFGISKRKMMAALLALAAVVGISASLLGTVLGLLCGRVLAHVASSTVKSLYDSLVDSAQLYWTGTDIGYGFAVGFLACFLGAIHPVYRITKIPIAQLMRDGSFEGHESGLTLKQSFILTLIIGALCALCLLTPVVWNRIPVTALLACLGLLVASALIAQQIAYLIYAGTRLMGFSPQKIAELRIFLAPQTAVVIQVLALNFTLTFGVKGMAESFRHTLVEWSNETLKADLWVRTVAGGSTPLPATVNSALQRAKDSGTALAVDSLTIVPALVQSMPEEPKKPVLLASANFTEQSKVTPLKVLVPNALSAQDQAVTARKIAAEAELCAATINQPCPAYISEPVSVHLMMPEPLNTLLCPEYRSQTLCFQVIGMYQDFGSDQGVILTDQRVFERLIPAAPQPSFSNVYLTKPSDQRAEQLIAELKTLSAESKGTVGFERLSDLRTRIMNTFDNTFRITDTLYLLCGIIAIIATVSSLNLQILLRNREWSLLWSMGLGQKTLLKRFSFWSAVMAFVAAIVSVFGGLALAAVLVYAVNFYSFGYSLSLKIPPELPVVVVLVAASCGYLSGRLQQASLVKNISLKSLNRE